MRLAFAYPANAEVVTTDNLVAIRVEEDDIEASIFVARGTPDELRAAGIIQETEAAPAALRDLTGEEPLIIRDFIPYPAWQVDAINESANLRQNLLIVIDESDWIFISAAAPIEDYDQAKAQIFDPFIESFKLLEKEPDGIFGARR